MNVQTSAAARAPLAWQPSAKKQCTPTARGCAQTGIQELLLTVTRLQLFVWLWIIIVLFSGWIDDSNTVGTVVGQASEQRDRTESRSTIPELLRAEIEAAADAEMCVRSRLASST